RGFRADEFSSRSRPTCHGHRPLSDADPSGGRKLCRLAYAIVTGTAVQGGGLADVEQGESDARIVLVGCELAQSGHTPVFGADARGSYLDQISGVHAPRL